MFNFLMPYLWEAHIRTSCSKTFKNMFFKFILFITSIFVSQDVWANSFLLQSASDRPPHIAGPNCWNQALMSISLLDTPRFTSAEEFVYLVQAHCEQVPQPSYGSLGRMQDDQGDVHAFIYISESEVFAKNSMGALEQPGYMSFEDMFKTYLVKDIAECSVVNTMADQQVSLTLVSNSQLARVNAPICMRQISYYNCQSLKPAIQRQMTELQAMNLTLHQIVFNFETMARPRYSCDAAFLTHRFNLVRRLIDQIQTFKTQGLIFDLEYLQTWVISARLQIDEIERSSFSERCMTSNPEYLKNYQLFQNARDSLTAILN